MARARKRADSAATPPPPPNGNGSVAQPRKGPQGRKPKDKSQKAAERAQKAAEIAAIAKAALASPVTLPEVTAEQIEAERKRQQEEAPRVAPRVALPWLGSLTANGDDLASVRAANQKVFTRSKHQHKKNEIFTTKRGTKPSLLSDEEKVNFCTLIRVGIGRNAAVANLGMSALRLQRTLMVDPVFAAQLKVIEKARRDDCEALLYQTAMTPGHDFQMMAAVKYIGIQERAERYHGNRRIALMDLAIRQQMANEKIQGGAAVEDRIDYKRLTPDERDEYDYLSEKLHVDQEFTAEEALAYVRITRKLVQAAPTASGDVSQQGGGSGAMRQLELDSSDDTD